MAEEVEYWTIGGRKMKKDVTIPFLLTLLDSVCLMMHMTLLPYLIKEDIGMSDIQFGYIQTLFGLCQLIGGPILGRVSDEYGARLGMTFSFSAATVSYIILSTATTPAVAYASRLFGCGMHGLQAGQTVLTAVTSGSERTSSFSRIGIMFGLGLLIGPAFGGMLSNFGGHRFTLGVCAVLSMIGAILTYIYCPGDSKLVKDDKEKKAKIPERGIKNYLNILWRPRVGKMFTLKNLSAVPVMITQPILGLHLLNTYKLTPTMNALIATYSGVCFALANGVGVVSVRKYLSEPQSATLALWLLLVSNAALGFFNSIWQLFFILPPLCLGMCVISVICDAKMTELVGAEEQGTILGLSFASQSAVRTVAPILSTFIIAQFGFGFFGYVSIIVGILTLVINGGFDEDSVKKDH